jgi:hypothetical protein
MDFERMHELEKEMLEIGLPTIEEAREAVPATKTDIARAVRTLTIRIGIAAVALFAALASIGFFRK